MTTRPDPAQEREIEAQRREQCFADAGGEREFTPQFGDTIRGVWASEKNPQRDGFYVQTVRLQSEKCYRLTDGHGNFWAYPAHNTVRVARAAVPPEASKDSARLPSWEGNGMVRAMVRLSKALGHKPGATVEADEAQCVEAALIELAADRLAVPALPVPPKQPKELSDEQIVKIAHGLGLHGMPSAFCRLARAVLAAPVEPPEQPKTEKGHLALSTSDAASVVMADRDAAGVKEISKC